ncbi:hypothetical protein PVAP13_2KG375721 [Panicum virgatum]|uniref:Uncharacterized protein n=1 Tax=Panicum virgatum TaxID=38727 RepID=A0A8T0WAA9_PANVG|nr:hypothetical protein PVAP13_2KG375721 [Panicum virgatum]
MQIYTSSLLKRKLPLLDAPPVGGERRRGVRGTPAEESAGGSTGPRLSPPSSLPSPTPTRGAPPLSPSAAPLAAISLSAPPRRLLRRPALLHSARGTPAAPPRGSRGSGLGRGAASGAGDPRRSAPTPSHPWPAAMARSGWSWREQPAYGGETGGQHERRRKLGTHRWQGGAARRAEQPDPPLGATLRRAEASSLGGGGGGSGRQSSCGAGGGWCPASGENACFLFCCIQRSIRCLCISNQGKREEIGFCVSCFFARDLEQRS